MHYAIDKEIAQCYYDNRNCVTQKGDGELLNTNKVKGKMAELGLTQKDIAAKTVWNCALPTVSQKINGIRPITLDEADALAEILHLSNDEYKEIFFTKKIALRK